MKWYHWIGVVALVAAVVYGPAAIGWTWDHGVVPLARTIAGADDVIPITIVVGVAPEADVADEAAVAPAPEPTPAPMAAKCTTQGIALTDGNTGMEAAPVGGAFEPCYIVAQIHGLDGRGYVMVLAPTQWIRLSAKGGAGWYVMEANLEAEIANSVNSIVARGEATPTVIRFDQGAAADAMPGVTAGPYTGPLAP